MRACTRCPLFATATETPVTGELCSEAYVTVLAIGEEILIKQPDLCEERAPVEGFCRTRPEYERLLVELPRSNSP